jgi:hypothetical protein
MSFVDLTDVKETTNILEPGEYSVSCVDAKRQLTKSGTGEYIKAQFKTEAGFIIFHNFNIKNDNKQAQDIGLGQLKSFVNAAGGNLKLTSPDELCGLQCKVKVKTKSDDYGDRTVITTFKKPAVTEKSEQLPF